MTCQISASSSCELHIAQATQLRLQRLRSPTTTPVNRAGASIAAAAAATSSTVTAASRPGWSRSQVSSSPRPGQHGQRRRQAGLGGQRGGQRAERVVPRRFDLGGGRRQQADLASSYRASSSAGAVDGVVVSNATVTAAVPGQNSNDDRAL